MGGDRRDGSDGDRAWRLLQALPDPVVVADAHGVIELINVQAVALFGYEADELIGQPVELLIPPGLHDVHRGHRSEYVASEQPTPMSTGPDIVGVRKDGTTVPVEVTLSAITLSTGMSVLASIRDVSDRKAAEAELRISDERFRVSFDSAPIGMALIDLRREDPGHFLRVNQALCDLTGYPEDELLLSSSPAITHPEDRRDTVLNLERLVNGDATRWSTEKRYLSATGDDVWVHFAVSVVHGADGRPSYGVSQVEDITERKQAEDQLAERFHELATNVGVGFAVRRLDPPEFLYVNPAFRRILGLGDGTPLTREVAVSLVHPDDLERARSAIDAAAAGRSMTQEWRLLRPDGQVRWVSERVSPIIDEHGGVPRVASVLEDITDRKWADLALQESEQRFDQLARNIDVGIFLGTPEELLYMNPALFRIYGIAPDAPNPTVAEVTSLIDPADAIGSAAMLNAAEHGPVGPVELRLLGLDGMVRWVSATRYRVDTPEGEPDRYAGTVTDITERKAAEEEAADARAEAEAANAAKDEFLSRMSHELRTPLNAILGFAQLLEMEDLADEQKDNVTQVRLAGEHLLTLVDEVLDITGVERGRLRLSLEPVGVLDVVDAAVAMLRPLAARRDVSIVVDRDGLDVHVRADVQRFKQVIVNLLANAVKYNRVAGEIRIAGRVREDRLRLEVSDTGIGIAAEDLARIFHPFERSAGDQTQIEGTGLGLAVTQSLMTAMAGRVGATSRLGEGSVFWLDLPATDPIEGVLVIPDRLGVAPAALPAEPRTVLYVEDNLSNVRLLERVLTNRPGIGLEVATTGRLGLRKALDDPPDLVLLDLHLPDISGEEVLRALRADPRTATTPVVVLSGDALPGTALRLRAAGATDYLTKPLDLALLLGVVEALTRTRPEGETAPRPEVRTPASVPPAVDESVAAGRPAGLTIDDFAHDASNELGVILTYCSLLAPEPGSAIESELAIIRAAAQAVAGLIDELLAAPTES